MKTLFAILLVALATACASMVAKTPAQRVYALQADYNAVLSAAVVYVKAPRCTATVTTACSSQAVVDLLRKADIDAYAAVKAAQDTVRDPAASTTTINLVITAGVNAVSAFRSIAVNHGLGGL